MSPIGSVLRFCTIFGVLGLGIKLRLPRVNKDLTNLQLSGFELLQIMLVLKAAQQNWTMCVFMIKVEAFAAKLEVYSWDHHIAVVWPWLFGLNNNQFELDDAYNTLWKSVQWSCIQIGGQLVVHKRIIETVFSETSLYSDFLHQLLINWAIKAHNADYSRFSCRLP